jgi:Tol biopolymer transport system component
MYVQNLAGSAASELLFTSKGAQTGTGGLWPGSWSADGQQMAFMHAASAGGDISLYDRRAGGRSAPLISGPATEWGARLSPDGHSLAYVSNESGRWQVYLQALPTPGARVQISADGGTEVVWARNGRELFYRNGPRVIAVAIEPGGGLKIGKTTVLFEGPFAAGQPGLPNYDVAPDGRFVMVEPGPDERTTPQLHVLLNWPALLR